MAWLIFAYVVYLLFIGGTAALGVHQARKYRCKGDLVHVANFFFVVALVVVVVISFLFIGTTDWSSETV